MFILNQGCVILSKALVLWLMFVCNQLVICIHSGGVVAQSVERTTPVEEALGSISALTVRSLLVRSVSVEVSFGTCPRYSPVVDEQTIHSDLVHPVFCN